MAFLTDVNLLKTIDWLVSEGVLRYVRRPDNTVTWEVEKCLNITAGVGTTLRRKND